MNPKQEKYASIVVLLFLVIVTILLRLPMLKYGMPFDLGDEDENGFIGCALNYGATHSLKPILTWYPAFYSYLLAAAYAVYFLIEYLGGDISSTTDFAVRYLMHPGYFHFIGRLISVIFSCGCVILIFMSGKKLRDEITGLIAATMFTFSTTGLIRTSWALPDATYLLMTIFSIYYLLKYAETYKNSDVFWSGIFCGLAIATKYNTGTLILLGVSGIALAGWSSRKELSIPQKVLKLIKIKTFYFFGAVICIGFFIGSPYFFINLNTHLSGLSWEIGRLGSETGGSSAFLSSLPYIWIVSEMLVWERGVGVLALVGLAYGIYRGARGDREFLFFVPYLLVTFFMIGRYQKHSLHYLLPIFPALFLVSAIAFRQIIVHKKKVIFLFYIVAVIAFISNSDKLLSYRSEYTKQDTRIAAREWIMENVSNGSSIAVGRTINGPPLPDPMRFDKLRYSMIGEQVMSKRLPDKIKRAFAKKLNSKYFNVENYIVKQSEGRSKSYLHMMDDFDILPMRQIGTEMPDYIIYSSFDRNYLEMNGYHNLMEVPGMEMKLEVVKEFISNRGRLSGPNIVIYYNSGKNL